MTEEGRTNTHRIRLLRHLLAERTLQIPVHHVRLDAHGPVPDGRPGALHHEQHLRGSDLVLHPRGSRHHQRHLRIYLRYHVWPDTAHQAFAQEDSRRLRRCMGLHHRLWLWPD